MEQLDLNNFKAVNKNFIEHSGVISKITKTVVTVSLEGNINCEACNAKAACGVSESNSKEIEIENTNQSFQLNEGVDVIMLKELGLKAVFWAYIFPFILLFIVLIVSSIFFKEWIAGLISIFILIPYYLALYLLQNSFRNYFKISIIKNK